MRPLKLTMQAFGPYASKEEIDFTRLGSRTMFVISGKTGAGKTTIFDGISYAIYGKASGEDRNGSDLRSQFAEEGLPTEIALEFSLRNKRYYIKRSPQQEKKKDRGEGFTTVGAKAELYLYDEEGSWQLLAANVRDTDIKIKEIMLIDSNQFRQILMIPQGEFRKLLTSDSKDKEVILQRLFHTEIYKRVEDKLKKEATDLKNLVEMQTKDRDQAIRHIQASFHDELKTLLDEGSTNDAIILPLLKEEIDQSAAELLKLKKEMDEKEREKDKLQQQLFEAEAILKQIKSKEELQSQKAVLEEQKPLIDEKEQSIIQAQKAALLMNQEEQCDRLKRELEGAKENVEAILKEIKSLREMHSECEYVFNREKEREAERSEALEQINALKNMEEAVRSISQSRLEVDELNKQLHAKSADKKRTEERIKAADQEIQKRNEERKQIEKEQLVFYENERKMDKLEREYEQLVQYEKQQNTYKQNVRDTQRKLDYFQHSLARYEDAKTLVAELEQRWLHGQAAILANKLQNGESCPVCGSTHHPSRAVSTREDIPNEEDLKVAKHEATRLETEKSSAESAFFKAQSTEKALEENLTELLNRIVEHKPHFVADELEMVKGAVWEEKQMLQTEQSHLQKNKEKLLTIIEDLEKYEKESRAQSDQLLNMTEVVNDLTIQFTQKNTLLLQMLEKVPERLQTITAYEAELQTAVRHHETLVENLEQAEKRYQQTNEKLAKEQVRYEEAEKQVKSLEMKRTVEWEAFKTKMTEQGFKEYVSYHESKKSDEEIQKLQQEVRFHHEEYRSVSDRFEELTKYLTGIKEPDMSGLNAAFEEIKKSIQLVQDRHTSLFVRKNENEQTVMKIERINHEIKSLEEKYQLIGHLSEMTKGQNTYRITFERYVLASFLDDILREANGRLAKMTSGRYALSRKEDRSKGNGQSGLELLVFDQYTGQERHVKTLSGGESFKAALSLALGLADIVQQYAGGVSLETMFIDEGFGTLDPESLDQAIESLIDIQSSGRLVGIISHVPELKERIDARLEVVATKSGSRTEFQFLNE